MQYQILQVKPFYHSLMLVYPDSPYRAYPGYAYGIVVQYQKDGIVVPISESSEENAPTMKRFLHPEKYKTPAELRQ